ncbi:MAG: hypothetical protein EAY75_04145 [Bacteroidetes bacterium]|nr:MAG: hypothetical protein EAY75_04145 [Bacteroidota bacterium]
MSHKSQSLQELQQIRQLMERSSRFISLSGLSGIAAGTCALVGAGLAMPYLQPGAGRANAAGSVQSRNGYDLSAWQADNLWVGILHSKLFHIAVGTFLAAFVSAFLFTWLKSRRQGIPIWGPASFRLMVNVSIPMLVGGIFCIKLLQTQNFDLLAPTTLIFYGLALLNASKYTFPEIRYLGMAMMLLGIANCWIIGQGIYLWATGFGLLHIVYGAYMWFAYEQKEAQA